MKKYSLTYYNIRGLAEPIRFMFAIANVPYEDIRIPYDPDSTLPLDIKQKTPWGQVPILEYNGKQLAQASAICRFLAEKFNLTGASEFEAAKCDEYVDSMKDLCIEAFRVIRLENDPAKKQELKSTMMATVIPKYLDKFESILKSNGNWLVGEGMTWADIYVVVYLSINMDFHNLPLLGGRPQLKRMFDNVYAHPRIKAWIEKRPKTNT